MEMVDYDTIKNCEVSAISAGKGYAVQGFIVRFVGESGVEKRICCSPEELAGLVSVFQEALEKEKKP
jgi:hypothetical protein